MRAERGGEPSLVAHRGRELAAVEERAQGLVDLDALADGLGERRRPVRHDHELLEVERVRGVPAAVDDVHQRDGQEPRARTAERPVEGLAPRGGRRPRHGERDGEHRIGPEPRLVVAAVERDEGGIDRRLIGAVTARERGRDDVAHVGDGAEHALAPVALRVSVAQLDGLALAGRGARRHGGRPARPAREGHRRLDGGKAARIEDLARRDGFDRCHCIPLRPAASSCCPACAPRRPTPPRGAASPGSPARARDRRRRPPRRACDG